MNAHDRLDDGARDRATVYVLESMAAHEIPDYEAHLAVCATCRSEVRALRDVFRGIAALAPAAVPHPALKSRLLDRIRAEQPAGAAVQSWRSWKPDRIAGGLTFVGADEGDWARTGVAGVEARRLFVDEKNDRVTMLVRMAAGTAYPSHRHAGFEECYVLEGDLLVGSRRMRAGDYQRAEGGSVHGVQSTEGGCLLFIVSSMHDELLPGART
jgi:anti-sigma factor ChrR (cupin superfamily)